MLDVSVSEFHTLSFVKALNLTSCASVTFDKDIRAFCCSWCISVLFQNVYRFGDLAMLEFHKIYSFLTRVAVEIKITNVKAKTETGKNW